MPIHLQLTNFKNMSSSEKSNLVKEILDEAAGISDPIVRQDLIKTLAQSAGVEENQIIHMFSQQLKKKRFQPKTTKSSPVARISQETIDRIRDTADIFDVVSHHVDLKKRGRNFFGPCPFHNEKTPSLIVAPDKGIYHCFGCGNGGNAIDFIMELARYEKINFMEALQQLGRQLGIPVMAKKGRPVGTTRANGYKVSPGRPKKLSTIEEIFYSRILNGFKNIVSRQI